MEYDLIFDYDYDISGGVFGVHAGASITCFLYGGRKVTISLVMSRALRIRVSQLRLYHDIHATFGILPSFT
jgi:hypothetical protein